MVSRSILLASTLPQAVGLLILAGVCGCSYWTTPGAVTQAPPETRADNVVETLHGVELVDPYRWLEDQESPETRAWIDEQNAYTDSLLGGVAGRDELRELATRLLKIDSIDSPAERGGRYFFEKRRADQELPVLYFRDGREGEDQVLIDPHGMSDDHTTSVGYRDYAKDGSLVVYEIRRGGVDETEIRILRVDDRTDLPDVLPADRYGGISLSPDKTVLYYSKYGNENPRVYAHTLGTAVAEDRELFGDGYAAQHILFPSLSDDGRWMLVHVIHGSSGPIEIHLKNLEENGPFRTLIRDGKSRSTAEIAGDQLIITTDLEAPNKRVMAADLDRPVVQDWRELIPESADIVLRDAVPMGAHLFVSYLEEVQPRAAIYDLQGNRVRDIEFETIGSVSGEKGRFDSSEAFFTFSSFHVPPTIYRYDVTTGEKAVWAKIEVPIEAETIAGSQARYSSKDGTRVPMFLVHPKELRLHGDNPTLLTGYGGFNVSRTPSFSALAAAWVQSGGVYALANLRGGGELGEVWHEAGMLDNKQNVFDDFTSAAEFLIAAGYTSSDRLAIHGGSNGGLLVGATMTQRPDLAKAVVCTYPLLDMVRYHKFLVARFWVSEYGSSDDPEQFRYLLRYSPYHNVYTGGRYPATLFLTGDGDTRVAPLHARKMAALVQARNASENPVLLRYHVKAGHSGGQPVKERIDEMVDVMSFLRWQVGIGAAAP